MDSIPNKMTIVTPWYGEFAGGAEVAARNYAEKLAQCGIKVEILTTCCKSPYDNWWIDSLEPGTYERNGVLIRRFPVNSKGQQLYEQAVVKHANRSKLSKKEKYNFFTYGINSDVLIEFAKNADTTAILALPYFQALTFSLIKEMPNRVSLIPCFHDEDQFYWEPIREMLLNARNIIFLSEEEKDLTIRNYGPIIGRKVVEAVVAGVGVKNKNNTIVVNVKNNEKLDSVRVKYSLPENFFLYVGRKEVGKGVLELVNWYREFISQQKKSDSKETPLVFIGGGDPSLIPSDTGFVDLGFVDEQDKQNLMQAAQGVINLSTNESFSLVIMEAWLRGTPVIVSSECEVTAGHCRRGHGGLPVKDVEEFCKALDILTKNQETNSTIGRQGYTYVCTNYNWPSVIEKIIYGITTNWRDCV